MLREVKEETGLKPKKNIEVAFFTQHINEKRGYQSIVPTYIFTVNEADQVKINDPDKETLSAEFFTIDDIIQKLKNNPFRVMKEPLIDYLKTKNGKIWTYRETTSQIQLLHSQNFSNPKINRR